MRMFLAVAVAAAFLCPGVVQARTKPVACPDGRFLQTAPIVGTSAGGAFDAVVLDHGTLAIASGCEPATAKLKAMKRGTRVRASWASCGTFTKVKLAGMIGTGAGGDCSRLKAVVKAKKHKPIKVDATRSTCGDTRVDAVAGETCDPPAAGSCSDTCQQVGAIVAPVGQWTWIPFPEAVCANGTATGIGVNLSNTSTRVAIYLMGGGACWDESTCYTLKIAANIDSGYGASQFATDASSILGGGFFDRDDPDNPIKDYSYVYVPYCTGDVHGGSNPDQVYGDKPTRHVGFQNMTKFLARIVPTFPDATRVVLSGSSAGGFGALTNWWQTQQAFGTVRVDLIDDSGPPLPTPYLSETLETTWRNAWNLNAAVPAGCTGCTDDLNAAFDFYAAQLPGNRAALLSYTNDSVISGFFQITGSQVAMGLDELYTQLSAHDIYRVFYKSGGGHVLFSPTTEESGVTLREFVSKMLNDDVTWANVVPAP